MIIFAIAIAIFLFFKVSEENRIEKRKETYRTMMEKYKTENGISEEARVVKYCSGIRAMDNAIIEQDISLIANEQDYFIWRNRESLNLLSCPLDYSTLENYFFNFEWKSSLDISKINYYTIQGDKYATTNIKGGGSSLGKAVIGGAIAGGAGAIIASREEITSTTDFIDERKTMIYYQDGEEVSNIILSGEAYDYLLNVIPEKEYSFVISQQKEQESKHSSLSNLEQLADLRDKGILTEEEFTIKKKQILGL